MSQRPNDPPVRPLMPPANGQPRDRSTGPESPFIRSDRGSFRQTPSRMNNGRTSGELEGSTLGGSSRDGTRRAPGQRRTQSSSGFLLDSLPRSRSTRASLHQPFPSEPPQVTRSVPEPDIVVPKKRSRFTWGRLKHHTSDLGPDDPSSSPISARQFSTPSDSQPPGGSLQHEVNEDNEEQPHSGLDRDSIQIVNLALNLNESRRRAASGIPPGTQSQRPISVSQPAVPVDSYAYHPRGRSFQRDSSYRSFTHISSNRLSQGTLPGLEQSSVVNLLPRSAVEDHRAYEFSENTLARAEKARNYFDLFHEYMRLLPSLPPLRDAVKEGAESKPQQPHRGYNPLQMIRNRKVRYREKCSIDADAEGWHEVERVHQWINHIEQKYSQREHDQLDCLKLPPFHQGRRHASSIGGNEYTDIVPTSPPSSLRRISRTSSMKARRPRIDWKISPEELLADAAWLEDGINKTKVVDKEGYKLYPDPTKLVIMKTQDAFVTPQKQRRSAEMGDIGETHSSPRTSYSSAHPALAQEFRSVGRGRHRHKFRSHSQSLRSRSASSKRKPSRWDRVKMRSGSVSSTSSSDSLPSFDGKPGTSREHPRAHAQRFVDHAQSGSRISRAKSPAIHDTDIDRGRTPQPTEPQSRGHRTGSISSTGSLDDQQDPRMSLEGMDSTAPSSPAHVGYFPSIAVNLSPPPSRSPSPVKKGLRHKIASRHERSKSKQADRERDQDREHEDELPEHDISHQRNVTAPARTESASKLEPSPLPDVVSSSYRDDQDIHEGNRADTHRSRKGPHLPESKLRGIFKGPGRIAEIVGNEVSKVGDLILKKDADPESRKSSSATTFASDDSDSDAESKGDKKSSSKGLLRRLPAFGDEPGRLTRRDLEKTSSRTFKPSLPTFISPLRQDERSQAYEATDLGSPRERLLAPRKDDSRESTKRLPLPRSKTIDFSTSLHPGRTKHHEIKDPSIPFSLTRPPVTGLANARASPEISPDGRRPGLSGASRAWSISGRSLQTLVDTGVPGKPEVERTRALLLSSGIKAREITRRAHTAREPAPHWLQSSIGPGVSLPRVTRINEFDLAAQNLLQRFEMTQQSFQQSMHHFSTTTSSPLRTQLTNLENLVNQSLAPRVRATANDAEDMCVQLNTTSTLAVKQLSDALDKGIRKRRRRLRWIRRTGFMVLEWALVAMLWWVWLIVMAFKLVRGVFRGAFSAVRWVLWL
ncbi:hypothetical protein N7457_003290 [Penicillium paradoxum]|uniref:uncharacterized protein n=1 Tax=Penicillium paradoxum TaxID=176176 RepID=UPI00254683C6|nr:uncharacterized protein N7457_003290 [Penicillium paradoxum]KAJ5788300.1 hypothetical protein N7457_003290 [Penicillium paradoxum]